uniref:Uncharacterized protein n=1 Tax=Gasterosteus aculeatus aculeatus TaxID=481459 RepID=A0AAQ4QG39_GASAC
MLNVLGTYISEVERVAGFPSCSESVRKVKPLMQKVLKDMHKCVSTKLVRNHPRDLRCYYIMDRLFSFSILSARVFAVGDPAHHTDGSAQNCM